MKPVKGRPSRPKLSQKCLGPLERITYEIDSQYGGFIRRKKETKKALYSYGITEIVEGIRAKLESGFKVTL